MLRLSSVGGLLSALVFCGDPESLARVTPLFVGGLNIFSILVYTIILRKILRGRIMLLYYYTTSLVYAINLAYTNMLICYDTILLFLLKFRRFSP